MTSKHWSCAWGSLRHIRKDVSGARCAFVVRFLHYTQLSRSRSDVKNGGFRHVAWEHGKLGNADGKFMAWLSERGFGTPECRKLSRARIQDVRCVQPRPAREHRSSSVKLSLHSAVVRTQRTSHNLRVSASAACSNVFSACSPRQGTQGPGLIHRLVLHTAVGSPLSIRRPFPNPPSEYAKGQPTGDRLKEACTVFAGTRDREPDTISLPTAQGAASVQEVVCHARDIDPRPPNDPVEACRYRTEIGDKSAGRNYAMPTGVHSKLTKQPSPPIGTTLCLKRPADDERFRHRSLVTSRWMRSDTCLPPDNCPTPRRLAVI